MLVSAALRLRLYQDAYGWTELRLYVADDDRRARRWRWPSWRPWPLAGPDALAGPRPRGHRRRRAGRRSTSSRRRASWRHGTSSASSTRASSRPTATPVSTRPTSASSPTTPSRSSSRPCPRLPEAERAPRVRRLLDERQRELATDPALTGPAAWNLGRERRGTRSRRCRDRRRPASRRRYRWRMAPALRAASRTDARQGRPTGCPTDDGWLFEPKWDGFRALVFRDGDEVYTQSRDLKPLDRYFPELADPLRAALPDRCVLDGEVVIARRRRARLRGAAAADPSRRVAGQDARRRIARVVRRLGPARARRRGPPARCRRASGGRGSRPSSVASQPPVHLTPATRDRAIAGGLVRAVRGRRARRRRRQAARRALPAGQAGDAQDQAPADGRLRRRRVPLAQERPGHARRLAAARAVRRRRQAATTSAITSSFSWDRRAELAEELAPLRENALEGHPWREWAEWAAMGDADASGQRLPGATSRWNRGKDLSWEPLRAGARRRGRVRPPPGQPLPPRRRRSSAGDRTSRPKRAATTSSRRPCPYLLESIFGSEG